MRKVLSLGFFLTLSTFASGQEIGIPVPNWTVPPYRAPSAEGGLSTMADISDGVAFVAMEPCRVFDTRNVNGPYGGPRLLANTTRDFDINSGPCTGILSGVEAYSMNFGAILPDGIGFVTIWPTGLARPTVSSINTIPGYVLANAAIVPAGTNGQISVFPNTGMHLYGDINGYFTPNYNPGTLLIANVNNAGGQAVLGINSSTFAGSVGVEGRISTASAGSASAGVRGSNAGTGPGGVGVWGSQAGSGWGVYGSTPAGIGVNGEATNASGVIYGVRGRSASDSNNAAGVKGIGSPGIVPVDIYFPAGVRGEGRTGVLGIGPEFLGGGDGVAGVLINGFGNQVTYGALGTTFGSDPGSGAPPWGVFSGSTIGAVGTKHFLDPHPSDPKLVISYISLEGPEAGTYFRGRAKFQNGTARISVPEHFRLVTDPEGLTVQITPIGAMASFAVMKMDLNEIVVQASRNVEFSYLVHGVRATFKDTVPVQRTDVFMPRSADSKLPLWLSPTQKRLLIQNGTYREDGTVNMETAQRVGWDKVWEERARPAPQPEEP